MVYHPFRHLGLKVVSVAIAFLLWLAVAGEHVVERSLRIPLVLQNLPEHLESVDIVPETVDVRVRGSSTMLGSLGPGDLVAVVDMSAAQRGRRLFQLSPDQVRAPFGVEIVQVSPATLPMEFEPTGSRVIPIRAVVDGEPAEGHRVKSVAVDPAQVEVEGPETPLSSLEEAITEPISVAGASQTIRERVAIGVQNPGVRLKSARNALVTIEIEPVPLERTIPKVSVYPRDLRDGLDYRAAPDVVSITIRGSRDRLDVLEAEPLRAHVELAGVGPGRYNREVRVDTIPDIEILKVEPRTVRVTLR